MSHTGYGMEGRSLPSHGQLTLRAPLLSSLCLLGNSAYSFGSSSAKHKVKTRQQPSGFRCDSVQSRQNQSLGFAGQQFMVADFFPGNSTSCREKGEGRMLGMSLRGTSPRISSLRVPGVAAEPWGTCPLCPRCHRADSLAVLPLLSMNKGGGCAAILPVCESPLGSNLLTEWFPTCRAENRRSICHWCRAAQLPPLL